jgi:hypothetical protein
MILREVLMIGRAERNPLRLLGWFIDYKSCRLSMIRIIIGKAQESLWQFV